MTINIDWFNAEITIDQNSKTSFSMAQIHDDFYDVGWELINHIDRNYYLDHEFNEVECDLPIRSEGGYIEDPNKIDIEIISINIENSLMTVEFKSILNLELYFNLDVVAYDSVDDEYFTGASSDRYYQEELKINGTAIKDLNTADSMTLDLHNIVYPKLENEVTVSELLDITDQQLLMLISDSKFCPFIYFQKNISLIREELQILSKSSNPFAKGVMLHAYSISVLESYLLVRLCRLILKNDTFKNILASNLSQFYQMKKVEDLLKKSFHNADFLQKLLKIVFSFDISHHVNWLKHDVEIRNDCVHRAGLNNDDAQIRIDQEMLSGTVDNIMILANELEKQLADLFK